MLMNDLEKHFSGYIEDHIKPEYANPKGKGFNYQRCTEALNEFFSFDDVITEYSVRNFFHGDFSGKDALWIMLGLLQLHKVPYGDIFPPINVGNFLNDDGYFQTYHGMMYPRNSGLNEVEGLRFFELTISRGQDEFSPPSAKLCYKNKGDENRSPETREFSGTPVLSPRNDIVSILFQDNNPRIGTFFHFYFSYHMVNATDLRFKRGFVVTTLSNEGVHGVPAVLNFIMRSRSPIDSKTVKNHRGLETLLQHSGPSMCVPAEEFHAVLSEYHDVSYLFEPGDRLTAVEQKDLCVIDEPRILADIRDRVSSREDRVKAYHCLLKLKKASLSATHVTWEPLYDDLFMTITGAR